MDKKITVTISPLGMPKIEAHNYHGQGCAQATAGLEKALSGSGEKPTREYKPEWTETSTGQTESVKQGW